MQQLTKISDLKPYQKPHDSIFTTLITRHISRVFSYLLIKYDKHVTPNQISTLSLLIGILACILFVYLEYWWRIVGVILMQISFALDCSDGEVARFKEMGSKFGAWFDSVSDRFKEILMFAALTFNAYIVTPKIYILVIGAFTIIFWLLIAYIREAKKASWPDTRKAEMYITKTIYIGTVDVIIFLVCFAIIFQIEIYILALFLLVSLPLFFKQMRSAYKLSKQN